MHGIEHCNPERRTPRLPVPRLLFFASNRISTAKRVATLSQLGPDARDGLSFTCNDSGFHRLRSRVDSPGLPLRFLPAGSTVRSTFGSATHPGWPRDRRLHCLRPVTASSTGMACRVSCFHSSSGLLHPSGSKRSAGPLPAKPAFRFGPISVRSPQPLLLLDAASDQRSRFATFSEACCSSNLLEPHSL